MELEPSALVEGFADLLVLEPCYLEFDGHVADEARELGVVPVVGEDHSRLWLLRDFSLEGLESDHAVELVALHAGLVEEEECVRWIRAVLDQTLFRPPRFHGEPPECLLSPFAVENVALAHVEVVAEARLDQ